MPVIRATAEVRWFLPGPVPPDVRAWFDDLGPLVEAASPRTDCYVQPTGPGLNVKVREGRLEVKRRDAPGAVREWAAGVAGVVEHWRKWSFALDEAVRAMHSAYWQAVRKQRRLRAYRPDGAGGVAEVSDDAESEAGCEVELSEIQVDGQTWWSVCFEAFGPEDQLDRLLLDTARHVFAQSMPPTVLVSDHSMGYPAWLLQTR